jgi:hypothetical protein
VVQQGVSLDYIEKKEATEHSQNGKKKRKRKADGAELDEEPEDSRDMFSFINDCLSNRSNDQGTRSKSTASSRGEDSKLCKNRTKQELQCDLLKTKDSIALIHRDLQKAQEARDRNKDKDPVVARGYSQKIDKLHTTLTTLRKAEEKMKVEIGFVKEKHKLAYF